MSTAVDAAREEIAAALEVSDRLFEGARHFAELGDLREDTRAEVERSIADFGRRNSLLKNVRDSLTALVADGYPDVPERPVEASVLADLKQDAETINAALAKFAPAKAAELGLAAGAVEQKNA